MAAECGSGVRKQNIIHYNKRSIWVPRRLLHCLMPKSTRILANRPTLSPEQIAVTQTSKGIQIRLYVKPNSNTDKITDIKSRCVHVAVSEATREGEANRGVVELISGVRRFLGRCYLERLTVWPRFSESGSATQLLWQGTKAVKKLCSFTPTNHLSMKKSKSVR